MYIRHGGLLPPRATWAHQRRFEREWAKECEKKCDEAEMEKVLEDQRRGLFYDGRVANQKRKKANSLKTFESTLNHIVKTLPPDDVKSEAELSSVCTERSGGGQAVRSV